MAASVTALTAFELIRLGVLPQEEPLCQISIASPFLLGVVVANPDGFPYE